MQRYSRPHPMRARNQIHPVGLKRQAGRAAETIAQAEIHTRHALIERRQMVVLTDQHFLRDALFDQVSVDPEAYWHRPIIVTDMRTPWAK